MKNISVEIDEQGIATAVLDMPGRPFNVFSEDMMADLKTLIDSATGSAKNDSGMRALVITSGKSAFVAGADLGMIEDFGKMRFSATKQEMRTRYSYLGHIFRELEQLSIPVVAAINGLALGGGLELAMSCHARVAANSSHPMLGLPEILLGLLPGAGGTQRLPRLVGVLEAAKILLGGAPVTPEKALALGLVDEVVEQKDLLKQAKQLATQLLEQGGKVAPWDEDDYQLDEKSVAVLAQADARATLLAQGGWVEQKASLYPASNAIVDCMTQGNAKGFDDGCDVEWDIFVELMKHPIASSMVSTGFLNKTAAPKIAAANSRVEGFTPSIESVVWRAAETAPRRLVKMPVQETITEGECIEVVDIDQLDDRGNENVTRIVLQSLNDRSSVKLAANSLHLRYAGALAKCDAVELIANAATSKKALAQAVNFVSRLGLMPIVSKSGASVGELLAGSVMNTLTSYGLSSDAIVKLGAEIDADSLLSVASSGASLGQKDVSDKDELRRVGIDVLIQGALSVYKLLQEESNDCSSQAAERAGMVDLLANSGLGFPAWTGGPISLLSMVQYQELEGFEPSEEAVALVKEIPVQLKSAAGYLFTPL